MQFEINTDELKKVEAELGATARQTQLALKRALDRTAGTLRRLAAEGLKSELEVARMGVIRKRLKSMKFKGGGGELWVGLNPVPASVFRGSMVDTKTHGSNFSGKVGNATFAQGFVRKSKRRAGKAIFVRHSADRYPVGEAKIDIQSKAERFIEAKLMEQVGDIFWKHFLHEMKVRTTLGIGEK